MPFSTTISLQRKGEGSRGLEMMLEIPINGKTLASQMGRSPGYVAAMKAGGYTFTHGTRTLLSHALNWLREHPEFRSTGYRRNGPGFVKHRKRLR